MSLRPVVVKFPYKVDGQEEWNIIASAREDKISPYEVSGLAVRFYDANMNELVVEFNQRIFDDIEQMATELLIEEKWTPSVGY